MEAKLVTYSLRQLTSVKDVVALKQAANVFYITRLRKGPFYLVLWVHAEKHTRQELNCSEEFYG
jgi:hypothetical protein